MNVVYILKAVFSEPVIAFSLHIFDLSKGRHIAFCVIQEQCLSCTTNKIFTGFTSEELKAVFLIYWGSC